MLLELNKILPLKEEDFNDNLADQVSIFKNDEKYDYVRDLREGFDSQLKKSTSSKILETIPDWVFWDIKKPIGVEEQFIQNPYNPFRKYHT